MVLVLHSISRKGPDYKLETWFDIYEELEIERRKHQRPIVALTFDSQQQQFILVNSGGDASQVNVLFFSMVCHIELNGAPIPKLADQASLLVTFVISTPQYDPKEGTTSYLLAGRD